MATVYVNSDTSVTVESDKAAGTVTLTLANSTDGVNRPAPLTMTGNAAASTIVLTAEGCAELASAIGKGVATL